MAINKCVLRMGKLRGQDHFQGGGQNAPLKLPKNLHAITKAWKQIAPIIATKEAGKPGCKNQDSKKVRKQLKQSEGYFHLKSRKFA